ncbi:hypothetical protein CN918_30650 [Priestia megaterium]|nr:hypothetical protein CN918_30650 [Priestia megaterium]
MAKETTPSFVIQVEMDVSNFIIAKIERELDINRVMYNSTLRELLKREKQMKQTKVYKQQMRFLRAVNRKLSSADKTTEKELKKEKKKITDGLKLLREIYGLTEYCVHAFINPIRFHFRNAVNVNIAQKTATRAWKTFEKKHFGKAKKVRFVPKGDFLSFEGKTNGTGWRYHDRQVVVGKQKIPLLLSDKDVYLQEALHLIESQQEFNYTTKKGEKKTAPYTVKYVRIVKKDIRGKNRYYVQLVCAGYPPAKKDKNGRFKYPLGNGRVGCDIGTSSVAVASEQRVLLSNLADRIAPPDEVHRRIQLLQRQLDRSKRAMNPSYFRPDGTIVKGKKKWVFSNRYVKTKKKLKETHRKLALYRKESHQQLANELKTWGNDVYIEDMRFSSLQKRAKDTKKSEKTGKFQRKKRFGKSIAHRAPAMFVSIWKQKVKVAGGSFHEVNTWTFKASQYDHMTGKTTKKTLSQRWHVFENGLKVQRDVYSAFLLQQANEERKETCIKRCTEQFDRFKVLHDNEINQIQTEGRSVMNSGI